MSDFSDTPTSDSITLDDESNLHDLPPPAFDSGVGYSESIYSLNDPTNILEGPTTGSIGPKSVQMEPLIYMTRSSITQDPHIIVTESNDADEYTPIAWGILTRISSYEPPSRGLYATGDDDDPR